MAFGKAHRRGHIMAEINITPLTDVFLVLLIIFMITTSAMVKPAADVNLPETAEDQEETQGVMVTMTPSKQIYVGERSIEGDDAAIVSALRDALARADYDAARQACERIAPFESMRAMQGNGWNVTVVKQAMRAMGHAVGRARPPASPALPEPYARRVEALLAEWGILPAAKKTA